MSSANILYLDLSKIMLYFEELHIILSSLVAYGDLWVFTHVLYASACLTTEKLNLITEQLNLNFKLEFCSSHLFTEQL